MTADKKGNLMLVLVLFALAFFVAPYAKTDSLQFIPGNIGDARLNNYFLENIYQFICGESKSLWHLSFFSPFPYTLGFSDNLFGSFLAYLLPRVITGQADTAFQIWFLLGYPANFFAAYYSLRSLKLSCVAAVIGALIFAFALPTTAHSGHAQLHYRFGVPLAITAYIHFLHNKDVRLFTIAGAWLVWQFYCGIYMGFFTLLLLAALSAVYLVYNHRQSGSLAGFFKEIYVKWRSKSRSSKLTTLTVLAFLFFLMVLLFYPYLKVTVLYGAKRSWEEISPMLPRPESYFLSDASYWWGTQSKMISHIPMRHEHQMFIGAVPLLLALVGFCAGSRAKHGETYVLMSGALVTVVLLTLHVGGLSLWYLLYKLPLASAIRAMTRVDQVLLFLVGYLAAVGIDYLQSQRSWLKKIIWVAVLPLLIVEFSATSMQVSSKQEWRDRLYHNEAQFPQQLPDDPILFFAQTQGPYYADEIDAMWVSLRHGVQTLNGYSGMLPPKYSQQFGSDCTELPKRVQSYLAFIGKANDSEAYRSLMSRIVPIGFDCDESWETVMPTISSSNRIYSVDEIRNIRYEYKGKSLHDNKLQVKIKVTNTNNEPIAAKSAVGKPIRLSWRFVDANGVPQGGWETRQDLPFDIPANGSLTIHIPIEQVQEIKGGRLEVSLVQELVFWAHDIGIQPLVIFWE